MRFLKFFQASPFERFRSVERNLAEDQRRFEAVSAAVGTAIREFEFEHAGLSARLERATAAAAGLMGTDADDYLTRDPSDEDYLRKAEAEMKRASLRLREIDSHLQTLSRIHETLTDKGISQPEAPKAP
uniref:Uncharacterized protein n=1 Tax=Bosea sp. NBC_00436 TaxID=2969620 RepID=A0A9E8A3N8_9HYPH